MKVLVLVYVALVFVLDYKKKSKSKVGQDAVSHPGLSLHQLEGNPRAPFSVQSYPCTLNCIVSMLGVVPVSTVGVGSGAEA